MGPYIQQSRIETNPVSINVCRRGLLKKDFRGFLVGEAWPEGLEQEGLRMDGLLPVREGDAAVLVEVHGLTNHKSYTKLI